MCQVTLVIIKLWKYAYIYIYIYIYIYVCVCVCVCVHQLCFNDHCVAKVYAYKARAEIIKDWHRQSLALYGKHHNIKMGRIIKLPLQYP